LSLWLPLLQAPLIGFLDGSYHTSAIRGGENGDERSR